MVRLTVNKTAAKGIVIGKAYLVTEPDLTANRYKVEEDALSKEQAIFEEALSHSQDELTGLASESDIFEGHLMIAMDQTLSDTVISKMKENLYSAQAALEDTVIELSTLFDSMEDEYMRERAADVKDVGNRIMRQLKGMGGSSLGEIKDKVILIAKDLAPSDTAAMDFNYVLGFITEQGGVTSHVSIIARSLGVPALVGVTDILSHVKSNDMIIMDAENGTILINPDNNTIQQYKELEEKFKEKQEMLKKQNHLPAITNDGKEVSVCANVGSLEDIKNTLSIQIDGIGLFRSEFLYMESSHFPTEEEQFEVYKEAAILMEGKEVTIRTLDIGGDKSLPYYTFQTEENPFLGWRAIRISLDLKDVFKTQLKAILRASHYGYLRIMLPMIISVEEIEDAKSLIEVCKRELQSANIPFDEDIEIGIMIETPASVLCVDELASRVDFFSIGTNDLTQYVLCVDRGNKKISNLYNSFHPAVLRCIQTVINAAHKQEIKCGMCGEFASDSKAVKLLLGMGLDEFSMSASEIPAVKYLIRNSNFDEEVKNTSAILEAYKINDVMKLLHE